MTAVTLYLFVAVLTFALRHPWATITERMLRVAASPGTDDDGA